MREILDVIFDINNVTATIRMATPIALAAMGGAFSERSGVINIGLEGMILTGAFCGVLGSYISGSPWLGVLFAVVGGGLMGAILAVFAIKLKADHVVSGVGLNIFALGLTSWLMQVLWKNRGTSVSVNGLPMFSIPVVRDVPVLGTILGTHSPLVYMMLILIFLGWVVMFKTPLGLRIRMAGEHPEAADTVGINVHAVQYFSVILSGCLAGLGGAYLSLAQLNWFSMNMSAGRGYMALAANIFGQWNPIGGLGASFLFAFTDALQMRIQTSPIKLPTDIIQMLPYILTILVLAGAVIRSRPPAALGRHYESGRAA
ncbi:MAG: ABC transporter permease [Bacillota bacterium]|nr:ABC transporter permease [Bacillota bacterium]MDI6638577.1 ABC transporter permease [Bacillota bacterium]